LWSLAYSPRKIFAFPPPDDIHADASLFVGDDQGVDQEATAEMFMVMGGLSTMVFAVSFNMPYIVAPSVLYTTRESGYVCMHLRGSAGTCAIVRK